MRNKKLKPGDTIGIVSPSHIAERDRYQRIVHCINRHHIPVAYCDDFGHGSNHAILPIGRRAGLDAAGGTMTFLT